MSHIIKVGGAVKDGEAPPPLNLGYIVKVAGQVTGEIKEAL
jgi:hypothetical protein